MGKRPSQPPAQWRMLADAAPEDLAGLEMAPGIGTFSRYRSIITSLTSLKSLAADPHSELCLAHSGRRIVGYCVLRPPAEGERWARMQPPILHEVFGESARSWRSQGLMKSLLAAVCLKPSNEERILYIVGYSWHWDLDETGKTLTQYRDTIIHLLSPLGFRQYPTNEPNVALRPENLFMARLGDRLDDGLKKRFTNLLFGIYED